MSFSNDVYHCVISLFYSDITTCEMHSDVINVGLVDPTSPPKLTSDFNFDIDIQNIALYLLGSSVIVFHSQKMTAAANAMADRNTF